MPSSYRCHAIVEGREQCDARCWGQTAYCLWHNAFLSWRMLYMARKPLKRSAKWAPYDPGLITDWKPPAWLSTQGLVTMTVMTVAAAVVLPLFGYAPPGARAPTDFVAGALLNCALLTMAAMFFGNSSPAIPKLLLALACFLVLLQLYRVAGAYGSADAPRRFFELAGYAMLLSWAIPPPRGPILNARADVTDGSQLPPVNLGWGLVRAAGVVLSLILAGVAWRLATPA